MSKCNEGLLIGLRASSEPTRFYKNPYFSLQGRLRQCVGMAWLLHFSNCLLYIILESVCAIGGIQDSDGVLQLQARPLETNETGQIARVTYYFNLYLTLLLDLLMCQSLHCVTRVTEIFLHGFQPLHEAC